MNFQYFFQLPGKLKNYDNNPILYQFGRTIRNKILNYKEAINSIHGDKDAFFCLDTDHYEYADSFFYDPHHKHIITDLRLIQNKLRTSN